QKDRARDEATKDALRSAVEQSVGVLVTAQTLTDHYRLVADQILTRAPGYVKEYRIISEGPDGDLYRVKISAKVTLAPLKDDLAAIDLYKQLAGYPRLMVVGSEYLDGQERDTLIAQTYLERALVSSHFDLIDRAQSEALRARHAAINYDDPQKAAALGERFQAEYMVVFKANTDYNSSEVLYGLTFHHYRTSLNARIVKVDTAVLVKSLDASSEASAEGKETAASKALQDAAEAMSKKLVSSLLETWKEESQGSGAQLELVVTQMDFDNLEKLERSLKQVRGVLSVGKPQLDKGVATFRLQATMQGSDLASKLKTLDSMELAVDAVSQNRVEATLKR
ncbi:MAG: hypothetical protein V2A74_09130, partial [bacterium]